MFCLPVSNSPSVGPLPLLKVKYQGRKAPLPVGSQRLADLEPRELSGAPALAPIRAALSDVQASQGPRQNRSWGPGKGRRTATGVRSSSRGRSVRQGAGSVCTLSPSPDPASEALPGRARVAARQAEPCRAAPGSARGASPVLLAPPLSLSLQQQPLPSSARFQAIPGALSEAVPVGALVCAWLSAGDRGLLGHALTHSGRSVPNHCHERDRRHHPACRPRFGLSPGSTLLVMKGKVAGAAVGGAPSADVRSVRGTLAVCSGVPSPVMGMQRGPGPGAAVARTQARWQEGRAPAA